MSTQSAVNAAFGAEPDARAVRRLMGAWIAAVGALAFASWIAGADGGAIAGAAAALAAPGASGMALAGRLSARPAAWALIAGWILSAGALCAMSGGASGPGVALFFAGPALAHLSGGTWRILAAICASLASLVVADALALAMARARLGLFDEGAALLALALCGALIAVRRAAPRPRSTEGDALAVAAHEIRTPLTHIIGFADMMSAQIFGPLEPRYADYAAHIKSSGQAMLETLNAILDLSRIESGVFDLRKEDVDLAAEARAVIEEAEGSARPKSIALTLQAEPLHAQADPIAVRRMLMNLIGNAVKFTPPGGRVSLVVRRADGFAFLEVTDTGPGVPHAVRARLKENRNAVRGAGLGLPLVAALAKLHGGALDIGDAPGGGAVLRIKLPI